ncbi:hypothetical protein NDU88_002577 [Pleurodeles waltl]|uniref:Uncharacterized protein n=1 Tax=Pleurodeles waltl TaxID=8319 RepID=A0AAV7QAA0_PLEWA|nr:hypothetical protein NDU88_002577 [Pleurodeles waltl]
MKRYGAFRLRSISTVLVASLHSAGFREKSPGGTSTEDDSAESEYFWGEDFKGESEDRAEEKYAKESEDGAEEKDVEESEDGAEEEDTEDSGDGEENVEDAESSDDGEDPREEARTDGDLGPEADKEQCREEPTSRTPRHVPEGT